MMTFLADIGRAFGTRGFKWGIGVLLLIMAFGGGFVWGTARATGLVTDAVLKSADERISAAQRADQTVLAGYLAKLSAQTVHGEALSAALVKSQAELTAASRAAQRDISHAVPENSACDLSAAVVGLLNAQPARH